MPEAGFLRIYTAPADIRRSSALADEHSESRNEARAVIRRSSALADEHSESRNEVPAVIRVCTASVLRQTLIYRNLSDNIGNHKGDKFCGIFYKNFNVLIIE